MFRHVLINATTGDVLRDATKQEVRRANHAERYGSGLISIRGARFYVQEG